jgi:hypothetical protein
VKDIGRDIIEILLRHLPGGAEKYHISQYVRYASRDLKPNSIICHMLKIECIRVRPILIGLKILLWIERSG